MKKLAELKPGDRFMYGGVEWVKFEDIGAGTICLAAEPVFLRAFDEENCNDWRKSSLRRELNGAFLDALVAEGADRGAFLDWESDLTADDGMTDYMNILVTITADTLENLEWRVAEVKRLMISQDMDLRVCRFRQEDAMRASMPFCNLDRKLFERGKRNVLTSAAASCYPFTSYEMSDENGVLVRGHGPQAPGRISWRR